MEHRQAGWSTATVRLGGTVLGFVYYSLFDSGQLSVVFLSLSG
jgi:hypothetical protein